MAIIDGDEGLVVLDPDEPTLERYRQAAAERTARFRGLAGLATLPAETLDGIGVGLWGNIEFPGEVAACLERGAVGVGLYRTEFLYLNADRAPTEAEHSTRTPRSFGR
ncbi:MAG: putative PEP-binding protein [Singulisphaera sp.]